MPYWIAGIDVHKKVLAVAVADVEVDEASDGRHNAGRSPSPGRLCRLIWKILHQRIRYEERGPAVSTEAKKVRARKMIRELRSLGYRVELPTPALGQSA
jgi:hypothetical protein